MNDSHSIILTRDYKFFDVARKVALGSDFKTKIGAVAVYGGKVIASAASSEKTHSLQAKYNRFRNFTLDCIDCLPKVHAEIRLIAKLKKMQGIDYRRVYIYVYRLCKSREHGLARPCSACWEAMKDLGIERVYYSTDIGYCVEIVEKERYKIKKVGA